MKETTNHFEASTFHQATRAPNMEPRRSSPWIQILVIVLQLPNSRKRPRPPPLEVGPEERSQRSLIPRTLNPSADRSAKVPRARKKSDKRRRSRYGAGNREKEGG